MKAPKAPAPPDPRVVAEAQTQSNKETATANAYLNRINQTNPFGSTTYTVDGTNPDGTPKFSESTAFSQPVQGLFDSYMGMTQGMADIGSGQLQGLQQQYSQPFNLDTEAENRIVALQRARLDPQMAQQDEALRNRLTNQGIREGTEAWDRALTRQGQISNDAYNSMYLGARQQGVNEALTQRQLPLNEFNAMRTGSQVGMPQFSNVPQVNQANTDIAGITQAGYQNQMAQWNAQNSQNNAFMGGLFQMGAALPLMFAPSDVRLKTDIERIGALPSGLPVYAYDYIWGGPRQVGVMAHEARELFPDAVAEFGGFLAVDYSRIG
jgi:hypothetical protein